MKRAAKNEFLGRMLDSPVLNIWSACGLKWILYSVQKFAKTIHCLKILTLSVVYYFEVKPPVAMLGYFFIVGSTADSSDAPPIFPRKLSIVKHGLYFGWATVWENRMNVAAFFVVVMNSTSFELSCIQKFFRMIWHERIFRITSENVTELGITFLLL